MLKSKYQVKEERSPKLNREIKEKRQTKNLSTLATYHEEQIPEDLMSWLD